MSARNYRHTRQTAARADSDRKTCATCRFFDRGESGRADPR